MSTSTLPLTSNAGFRVAVTIARAPLGHRPWLDGFRGLAILSVMAYHAGLLARGHAGVDLFFVVSGFLITTLLCQEERYTGSISLTRFYARRALRLFPALSVVLCASLLLMMVFPEVGRNYRSILYSAFYVTNWVIAFGWDQVSSTLYITWSLAIEEQFYLVWPILLSGLLKYRKSPRIVITGLALLLIAVCILRLILIAHGASEGRIGQASDTRCDGLIAGCLAGALVAFGRIPSIRIIRLAMAIMALLFAAYMLGLIATFGVGLTIINLFFASVIVLLLVDPPSGFLAILENPLLMWVGKLSYSIYLWHLFARFAADKCIEHPALQLIISTGLAFTLAAASHYLVERPFLKLKQRFSSF